MRKPYSIRMFNYDATSGGIKVMYGLYGALLLKGEMVIPNAVFEGESIGIYPEISQGNELQASRVVRYILNKPGVMTQNGIPGPSSFPKTDMQFVFSKMFAPETPEDRLLFLPIINTAVFYDKYKKRDKKAVFEGKGVTSVALPDDCVSINRQVAQDQEGLADLLNECIVLYTFDPVSAMTEIARLCGCPVIYLSDVYSEEDYQLYEPGTNGMSFSMEKEPELDTEAFKAHYSDLQARFYDELLPNFIKITQNS